MVSDSAITFDGWVFINAPQPLRFQPVFGGSFFVVPQVFQGDPQSWQRFMFSPAMSGEETNLIETCDMERDGTIRTNESREIAATRFCVFVVSLRGFTSLNF